MPDEPISVMPQIAVPPFTASFTNRTTGAMLEILDTTNTTLAPTGTNSKIAPGDLLAGYLAAGSNVTLTETSGIVTIAAPPVTQNAQAATFNPSGGYQQLTSGYNNSYANVSPTCSLTISTVGTYLVFATIHTAVQVNASQLNDSGEIDARIYDTTNSVVVAAAAAVYEAMQVTGTQVSAGSQTVIGPAIYTITAEPVTLQFQAQYQIGGSPTSTNFYIFSNASGYTTLTAIRIY
jgi:hypothetical protein